MQLFVIFPSNFFFFRVLMYRDPRQRGDFVDLEMLIDVSVTEASKYIHAGYTYWMHSGVALS